MNRNRAAAFLMLVVSLGLFLTNQLTAADEKDAWGTVKGQVVFGGDAIPPPKPIDVSNNQDKQHCLSKGPLLSDEWTRSTLDDRVAGARGYRAALACASEPQAD